MRTNFTQNEFSAFRTQPQRSRWFLGVHQPASVFSSKILTTPVQWPASTVIIDTAFNAGDATLTSKNMTIWVGTLAGASDQGKIRLRRPVSGSVVRVGETGSGLLRYSAGNFLTVIKEFYPWVKHPRFDLSASKWRMDYDEIYSDELDVGTLGPVVVMGPPFAGFLDGGTVTGSFVGTSTQFVDTTISSAKWEWQGGSTDSKVGAEHDPTIKVFDTASPSGDYFSLAVTDSGATSQISRRLAFAFADRTGPAQVEFAEVSGGLRDGGYTGTLRVLSGANTDQFPDGAEIVIFEEASYGGLASTIGGNYPFRTNIVLRGWITDETVNINPFSGDVSFNFMTLDGVLNKTLSYDIFHAYVDAVTGASPWQEFENLTLDRNAIDVIKHRSTIAEITDFHLASGLPMTTIINFQDLPQSSVWKQLQLNYGAKGTRGLVTADMQSNIWATEDALISGGSATLPKADVIEKRDRRDTITIVHPHLDPNAKTEMYGVMTIPATSSWRGSATSIIPVGGESPGDAIGYFGGKREHSRGIAADTQDRIITWAGNWRAKLNNPYPNVVVPLAGNIKWDAVPQSRVSLTASSTDVENVRGIDWDDKEFLPHTTLMMYNNQFGNVLTTIQVESVVDGKGGSAITFPRADNITPLPPPNPPDPPAPKGPGGDLITFNDTVGTYRLIPTGRWQDRNTGLAGTDLEDSYGKNSPLTTEPLFPQWKGVVGKVLRTTTAGDSWENVSPSQNPPNGTTSAVDFIWYTGDPTNASRHVTLGRQSKGGGTWGTWLAVTSDNGTNWNWQEIAGAATVGASATPFGGPTLLNNDEEADFGKRSDWQLRISAGLDATTAVIPTDTSQVGATNTLRLQVATISGTSITSSSPLTVPETGTSEINSISMSRQTDDSFVLTYEENSHTGGQAHRLKAVVGQVISATSVNFGNTEHITVSPSALRSTGGHQSTRLTDAGALLVYSDGKDDTTCAIKLNISGNTSLTVAGNFDIDGTFDHNGVFCHSNDGTIALVTAGSRAAAGNAHGIIWGLGITGNSITTDAAKTIFKHDTSGFDGNAQVFQLDNSNFVISYRNAAANGDIEFISGTYTSGSFDFASSITLEPDATSSVGAYYMEKIDNTHLVIEYQPSGSAKTPMAYRVMTATGTSMDLGPRTQSSKGAVNNTTDHSVAVLGTAAIVGTFRDGGEFGGGSISTPIITEVGTLANTPGTDSKGYGAAIDVSGGSTYITYTDGTNLQFGSYSLPSLTEQVTTSLGAGTIAQADARTQVAHVEADAISTSKAYVYGRMSNPGGVASDPAHVIVTEDGGTTFSLIENNWGNDNCGGLATGISRETARGKSDAYMFRNIASSIGGVYVRSAATNTTTLRGTLPYEVNPGGMILSNGYLITGASSNKDNMIQYAIAPFFRWYTLDNGYPNSGGIVGIGTV